VHSPIALTASSTQSLQMLARSLTTIFATCTAVLPQNEQSDDASAASPAARADRRCANPACNEPLVAQRSTAKFCSVRCRVAVHRERMR
jgi:hypothetical protein